MRRISGSACVLLGLALGMSSCMKLDFFKRAEPPTTVAQGPAVGSLAPEIDGADFSSTRMKLSDYRGKVVVLSFWTSW